LNLLRPSPKINELYWISMLTDDRMLYVEVMPSKEMLQSKNYPQLFIDNADPAVIRGRSNEQPQDLGQSPVNLGMYFDLTRMIKGEHRLAIRLYFENYFSEPVLNGFRSMPYWNIQVFRI